MKRVYLFAAAGLLAATSTVWLSCVSAQTPPAKGQPAPAKAGETHDLTVNVTALTGKEDIVIALFTNKDGFPDNTGKAAKSVTVKAGKPIHTFEKLPAGKYVVVVFQDKDGDGKLTKGAFGPPKEPIGLSNHPKIGFGNMPDFDKAKVDVSKATSIDVNLISVGK
jgi:uncharacterized protein (DUF2141 family)